jgi:glycosyltransferase involved in cell wall biosynthesis
MSKSRVLMIAWSDLRFYPPVMNLGTALYLRGTDVRLIGFRSRNVEDDPKNCEEPFSIQRVAGYPDGWRKKVVCFARMTLCMLRSCVHWRPNVIVAHGSQAVGLALFASVLCRARVIYCAHEISGDRYGSLALTLSRTVERLVAKRFDNVICADHDRADILQTQLALATRPTVIPNSPLSSTRDCGCEVRSAVQVARKASIAVRHVVVYAGRVGRDMALEELCCAMSLLSDSYSLVIAGAVDADFESQAQALFGLPRIHYAGMVDYRHIRRWLQKASAGFVFYRPKDLNTRFAAPCKMYEYLAAGVPVVANQFPLALSIISRNRLGSCIPDSAPSTIASAIDEVCTHSDQLSNECRKFFISRLSYESCGEHALSAFCAAD